MCGGVQKRAIRRIMHGLGLASTPSQLSVLVSVGGQVHAVHTVGACRSSRAGWCTPCRAAWCSTAQHLRCRVEQNLVSCTRIETRAVHVVARTFVGDVIAEFKTLEIIFTHRSINKRSQSYVSVVAKGHSVRWKPPRGHIHHHPPTPPSKRRADPATHNPISARAQEGGVGVIDWSW